MKIEINEKEIIELSNFELSWRWAKTHSPDISDSELKQIIPVSESESQRLNKAIVYFEQERNLWGKYKQTDWIRATDETEEKESDFRSKLTSIIEPWNEGVIVTWNRRTTLKTSKEVFLKYWDDFCYPSSDDVTIISEETNWIMFYHHIEVANIWTKI